MSRRWAVAAGVLALALACAPVNGGDRNGGPAMALELRNVTALAEDADGTLRVTLQEAGEIVLREGENGVELSRDAPWLRGAARRGGPVGYDPATEQLLPATVAIELAWAHAGPDAEGRHVVFGSPRPGAMYVRPDTPGAARLVQTITDAIAAGDGAILALRDATWIEDVRVIQADEALRLLGAVGAH